ncbi:alpha/beta hydrolase [Lederbergia lenta]|uniref:Putative esterase n=1 Tax=Lederbergia lenta TaxID=1467 RepID=A0A2X4Z8U8_LEDLE|nr:alpha/beta hydrolase-fold protein [Lederbergia lenta]MEC2324025.1 alpha/beta hydrolase-fold protein [Lederbergia lenta]SQI60805.1 putative esterase [Lederbergia lenta]
MSIPQGTIKEIEFESSELNETLTLLLYLPASFSPLFNYSLVIAQDGKDYFQMGRLARYADELIDDGEIENIIAVGVPYKSVKDRRNKYHPQSKEHQAYIRFLAHELVPWIDREYPTYEVGKSRALMGDSLAATVSLLAALKYPNVFGKVILHSPYVNKSVLDAVNIHEFPHLLDVYHVIGDKESNVEISDMKDFLTPNRELHHLFEKKGFHHFYEEFSGGHSWKYWQPDVKRALQQMFS